MTSFYLYFSTVKKNPQHWIDKKKAHRSLLQPEALFQSLREGDHVALASAITLIESTNPDHRESANTLLKACLPYAGNSVRIGITGVPGVGKSTFIESFGKVLLQQGKKLAVLAIDPSSSVSGGSILGDKTRMQELSADKRVFIRPSPSGETLGGVARKTRETILLCEAAGFDTLLIETVGVGQSETLVKSMVDFFLLLMLSGAGDELQGIKKGIMEMADALVITKADGDNVKKANAAAGEYRNALHLFPANANGWIPEVFTCSALEGTNVERVFEVVERFERHTKARGDWEKQRHTQDKLWFNEALRDLILSNFFGDPQRISALKVLEQQVEAGELTSFQAAEIMYGNYVSGKI